MSNGTGLSVRQHERERIHLPAQLVIADKHRTQVRFAPSSRASDRHTVSGLAIDLSHGGLGMRSPLFLPRMCEGTIRIFDEPREDTVPVNASPAIEAPVKVRRARMETHEPTYVIGLAFLEPDEALQRSIDELCRRHAAHVEEYGESDA